VLGEDRVNMATETGTETGTETRTLKRVHPEGRTRRSAVEPPVGIEPTTYSLRVRSSSPYSPRPRGGSIRSRSITAPRMRPCRRSSGPTLPLEARLAKQQWMRLVAKAVPLASGWAACTSSAGRCRPTSRELASYPENVAAGEAVRITDV
jgi:hypothetical protein